MSEPINIKEELNDLILNKTGPMCAAVGELEKSIDEHVGSSGDELAKALHSYLKQELSAVHNRLIECYEFMEAKGGEA